MDESESSPLGKVSWDSISLGKHKTTDFSLWSYLVLLLRLKQNMLLYSDSTKEL